MSEENTNGAAAGAAAATNQAATGPSFRVEKIYAKDVSFESPGSPGIFTSQGQPQLQMNLSQNAQRIGEDTFEVVLGINLTCTVEDKTAYLVEIKQAGVFTLAGFEAQQLDVMLGVHCPNILFPYARQLTSSLVESGGFTPFLMQPINFEALYAEGVRQRAAQQQAQAGNQGNQGNLGDAEPQGNA